MRRAIRPIHVTKSALVPALAAGLAAAVAVSSCITGPPADLPQVPVQGPTIVQDAVMPPANQYLTYLPELPEQFVVPVRVSNPDTPILCNVYVDFDPGADNSRVANGTATRCPTMLPSVDGGVTLMTFSLSQTDIATNVVDPNACHTIQCFVAYTFDRFSPHSAGDSLGADSVTWQYSPNGPGSCAQFDAGDGAFPPADAPSDVLPVTPE
jgi:hypothetical protein